MAAHTKISKRRLILEFGIAEEKAKVLKDVMMDMPRDANAAIVIESD